MRVSYNLGGKVVFREGGVDSNTQITDPMTKASDISHKPKREVNRPIYLERLCVKKAPPTKLHYSALISL